MVSAIITGSVFTSCNTSAEKVENAQKNVTETIVDLDKANQEYLLDIENYRKETSDKIKANEQSIADFNARIENEKKKSKPIIKRK